MDKNQTIISVYENQLKNACSGEIILNIIDSRLRSLSYDMLSLDENF